MDKVRKCSNSECYTPEPFRNQRNTLYHETEHSYFIRVFPNFIWSRNAFVLEHFFTFCTFCMNFAVLTQWVFLAYSSRNYRFYCQNTQASAHCSGAAWHPCKKLTYHLVGLFCDFSLSHPGSEGSVFHLHWDSIHRRISILEGNGGRHGKIMEI
jgi:hypothetical protein